MNSQMNIKTILSGLLAGTLMLSVACGGNQQNATSTLPPTPNPNEGQPAPAGAPSPPSPDEPVPTQVTGASSPQPPPPPPASVPPDPSPDEPVPTQITAAPSPSGSADGPPEEALPTPTSTPLASTPRNTGPIKIHAVLITDDESLQRVPVVANALTADQEKNARASGVLSESSGSAYGDITTAQTAVENMVKGLNEDFYKLYPKNYWPGFELKKVSVRYDPKHAKLRSLQETNNALTALSTTGLTGHINLFISDLNESGSQGLTFLLGNIMASNGAPLLLSNSATTATFIHEMGHVIGVEHIAGTIPPPTYKPEGRPGYKLDLPGGSVFGYSGMDHSNPENSHMSGWTENILDRKSGFQGSLYLTSQTQSLLSPTYGRLFSEALRTWLINNHVIGLDSPRTGYTGVDTDNPDATAFWSWGNEILPTHPTLLKQSTYRNVFQDCVVNTVGSELASKVEIIVISGDDHISVYIPPQPEFEKVYECTLKYFVGKDSSILDKPFLQIPDELQAIFPNLVTSSSSYNQAAAAWQSGDSTAVRLGYRNNDGVWQKTESFVRDNNIIESSISMNAKGEALAIWAHWNGPGIETAYHGVDKEKWDTPLLISEATSQSAVTKRSRVVINDNGEAAAIWLSKADTDAETQLIFKSRSVEGVWSKTLVLQQAGQLIELPALALNNNGDALVTWQEMSSEGTFTIKGRYRIGANKYWSDVETYSSGSKHAGFAQPALNSDGNALIYWREADTDTAQLITIPYLQEFKILSPSAHLSVRSRTADGLLGTVHQLSPDGNDAFNSAVEIPDHNIVFTDKGEAVAAWHAFDGNDYRIYVARMNMDGVWGAPVALSKSGHHAKLPSMAIADDGSIAVTWQRSDGLHSRIRGSVFNSGLSQWSEPISLSKSGASAFWSNISFDGNGKFTVLWARYNNGSYIVESKNGELVRP